MKRLTARFAAGILRVSANGEAVRENTAFSWENESSAAENDSPGVANESSAAENDSPGGENESSGAENDSPGRANGASAGARAARKEVFMADWFPGAREGQLNMAKVWANVLQNKAASWGVPAGVLSELQASVAEADGILQKALSADRTSAITAECNRLFGVLAGKLRFIKDRYYKTPPLLDEDYAELLLKVPDTTRSPRGTPKAQKTAEIGRSGAAMLILHYKYAEGTEDLADPHTDARCQVRYGVLPPSGIAPAGTDLAKVPAAPEELPIVFATKRKKDIINFAAGDSGKTAYFAIRIENGAGGYGPWCPLFHAIVP